MPKKKTTKTTAKAKKTTKTAAASKKRSRKAKLLTGMKDQLPQEQHYWEYVRQSMTQTAQVYGFQRVEVPVLEDGGLFEKAYGKDAPIFLNEMFSMETEEDGDVALRPSLTPGIVRAYIEHGMENQPQPVKMWTDGPVFRNVEPKAGKYRQYNQVEWDVIGSLHAAVDGELISLGYRLLQDLGLDVMVKVNCLGAPDDRKEYEVALKEYLKPHRKKLDEESQEQYLKNPMRILGSKDPETIEILKEAPQMVDFLSDDAREHFMGVLEYLDEGDIVYQLNPMLFPAYEYATHTVFEFVLTSQQEEVVQQALGGGSRYNTLVHTLGGEENTTGVCMNLGLERVVIALKDAQVPVTELPQPDVYLAQIGETARKHALKLFDDLRKEGFAVVSNISKNALSDQIQLAKKSHAKVVLILGQKEMLDSTIIMRDMTDGSQESIDQERIVAQLKKHLK